MSNSNGSIKAIKSEFSSTNDMADEILRLRNELKHQQYQNETQSIVITSYMESDADFRHRAAELKKREDMLQKMLQAYQVQMQQGADYKKAWINLQDWVQFLDTDYSQAHNLVDQANKLFDSLETEVDLLQVQWLSSYFIRLATTLQNAAADAIEAHIQQRAVLLDDIRKTPHVTAFSETIFYQMFSHISQVVLKVGLSMIYQLLKLIADDMKDWQSNHHALADLILTTVENTGIVMQDAIARLCTIWPEEEKRYSEQRITDAIQHIHKHKQTTLTQEAYAEQHGYSRRSFTEWKKIWDLLDNWRKSRQLSAQK